MSSEPIRDPAKDHLLTPQNSALIIVDYQPTQINSIKSMDHQVLTDHIVTVAKTAIAYGPMPIQGEMPKSICERVLVGKIADGQQANTLRSLM